MEPGADVTGGGAVVTRECRLNSRKTTWFPPLGKMRPLPATASQGLRVPWTARRSNQSILKEISPGCSLEGMMLKLKLQYFGHLMRRVDALENIRDLIFLSRAGASCHAAVTSVSPQEGEQPLLESLASSPVMPSSHLTLCHPLLLRPHSLLASESFPMSQLFT